MATPWTPLNPADPFTADYSQLQKDAAAYVAAQTEAVQAQQTFEAQLNALEHLSALATSNPQVIILQFMMLFAGPADTSIEDNMGLYGDATNIQSDVANCNNDLAADMHPLATDPNANSMTPVQWEAQDTSLMLLALGNTGTASNPQSVTLPTNWTQTDITAVSDALGGTATASLVGQFQSTRAAIYYTGDKYAQYFNPTWTPWSANPPTTPTLFFDVSGTTPPVTPYPNPPTNYMQTAGQMEDYEGIQGDPDFAVEANTLFTTAHNENEGTLGAAGQAVSAQISYLSTVDKAVQSFASDGFHASQSVTESAVSNQISR